MLKLPGIGSPVTFKGQSSADTDAVWKRLQARDAECARTFWASDHDSFSSKDSSSSTNEQDNMLDRFIRSKGVSPELVRPTVDPSDRFFSHSHPITPHLPAAEIPQYLAPTPHRVFSEPPEITPPLAVEETIQQVMNTPHHFISEPHESSQRLSAEEAIPNLVPTPPRFISGSQEVNPPPSRRETIQHWLDTTDSSEPAEVNPFAQEPSPQIQKTGPDFNCAIYKPALLQFYDQQKQLNPTRTARSIVREFNQQHGLALKDSTTEKWIAKHKKQLAQLKNGSI